MTSYLTPFEHPEGARDEHGRFEPFYVPRVIMPQIEDSALPDLLTYLSERQVAVHHMDLPAHKVRPHQTVHFERGAKRPEERNLAIMEKPILVSLDMYIIDGHHRWALHLATGSAVPTIVIEMEWNDAIELINAFPGVKHAEVGQIDNL